MTQRDRQDEAIGVIRRLMRGERVTHKSDWFTMQDAALQLLNTYGVHFDPALRDEVVARVDHLQLPSYSGFVMPSLAAVTDDTGAITDVTISYPLDLATQMLEYSAATRHLRA